MERCEAYPTDIHHIVNLSGYVWAVRQLADMGGLRVLDIACGTGYGSILRGLLKSLTTWAIPLSVLPKRASAFRLSLSHSVACPSSLSVFLTP